MQVKKLIFSLCFLCSVFGLMAQNAITVKGTITSKSDGEPIIGASVVQTNSPNVGTATDLDGNFVLKVADGSTITVSYIGYKSVTVKAASTVNIELVEDAQMMDELVVTGYTTQRKKDLTGAVSVMNLKNPLSESNPNMLGSMQGKLAGVQIITDQAPGSGGTSIRVRGMSTVNGNDPLYIVDGVPTTENLNSINPADIESIQVLKDAASASIYGSRAANGVIIITTKSGKGDKLTVNVGYSCSVSTPIKTYDMLSAEQWGEAYWLANKNAGLKPSHPFYGNGDTPQLVEYLDADGLVRASNTDWQDQVYSNSVTHNVTATITNSGSKGSMMFSGNFIDQNGLMDYTFYRRYSARMNSTYNICDYVKVGENFMVAQWNNRGYGTNNDRGIPFTAMRQHPAIPVRDSNGNFTNPLALCASDIANPVHELYNGRDNSNQSWRIFGNAYLEVYPVKGLTLKSNIGIEHIQFFNRTLNRKIQESDMNSMSRGFGQGDTWTWTNTANYNLTVKKHNLNVLGGVEAISYKYENLDAWRSQYAFEDDNYMNLDSGEGTQTNGGGCAEWALFSLFAKADYNYADRYLLSAIIRRDATSRLYKDNNSGVFPAFSGAWRFTNEEFFPKNDILTDGKVRIGWGQNGNAAISNNYASYSTYAYNLGSGAYDLYGTNANTVAGIIAATTGNPDLKWETTTQTNVGLDFGLINNSLSVSMDYYIKKTKDMLTIPPTLSVEGENAARWMNTGDMENKGFELTIDYRSPEYGDFSWGANLNLSRYKNKLVKYNNMVKNVGGDVRLIEGEPMGVYYGYVVDGIFQNKDQVSNHAIQQGADVGRLMYRDIDGNGVINDKDQCIIGDPNPDFTAGLNLDLRWKGFTLSAFFTGEFGFDVYNTTKRQLDFMSSGIISTNRGVDILNAWSETNTNSSIPAISVVDNNNEMRMSTYYVEDGTYVKMKYLKLQYSFPTNILKKIKAESLNVYAQVENVFTATGYSGLNPELPLGGYGARIDNGPYPTPRTYTFGVNVQF